MKDYSQKFNNPESFITDIMINNEEEIILVTFANKVTFTYPLNKENLNILMDRYTSQYKELVKNGKNILADNKWTGKFFLGLIPIGALILLGALTNTEPLMFVGAGMTVLDMMGIMINENIVKKKVSDELAIYREFLEHKDELMQAAHTEKNVIDAIKTMPTALALREQSALRKEGLIDNEFNVSFMDKSELKDLKALLLRLKIYKGLQEEVSYIESTEEKGLVRTRKPNQNK